MLFEEYSPRAEDEGQEPELERDYAASVSELSSLLLQAVHTQSATTDTANGDVATLLAES
jgi:hypothetical protein